MRSKSVGANSWEQMCRYVSVHDASSSFAIINQRSPEKRLRLPGSEPMRRTIEPVKSNNEIGSESRL
jgi:hypothetical protein